MGVLIADLYHILNQVQGASDIY